MYRYFSCIFLLFFESFILKISHKFKHRVIEVSCLLSSMAVVARAISAGIKCVTETDILNIACDICKRLLTMFYILRLC